MLADTLPTFRNQQYVSSPPVYGLLEISKRWSKPPVRETEAPLPRSISFSSSNLSPTSDTPALFMCGTDNTSIQTPGFKRPPSPTTQQICTPILCRQRPKSIRRLRHCGPRRLHTARGRRLPQTHPHLLLSTARSKMSTSREEQR